MNIAFYVYINFTEKKKKKSGGILLMNLRTGATRLPMLRHEMKNATNQAYHH